MVLKVIQILWRIELHAVSVYTYLAVFVALDLKKMYGRHNVPEWYSGMDQERPRTKT